MDRPQPEHLVSDAMKKPAISLEESYRILAEEMRKLACRDHSDHLGDSKTNIMAQRALVRAGIAL